MTEQTQDTGTNNKEIISVIPKGEDARKAFYDSLNEWIKLHYIIESAQSSQKDILKAIFQSHKDNINEDAKKTDVDKAVKGIIGEFLEGRVTDAVTTAQDILDDYEIAKKHLKG